MHVAHVPAQVPRQRGQAAPAVAAVARRALIAPPGSTADAAVGAFFAHAKPITATINTRTNVTIALFIRSP
jgi:hypothetical protein